MLDTPHMLFFNLFDVARDFGHSVATPDKTLYNSAKSRITSTTSFVKGVIGVGQLKHEVKVRVGARVIKMQVLIAGL